MTEIIINQRFSFPCSSQRPPPPPSPDTPAPRSVLRQPRVILPPPRRTEERGFKEGGLIPFGKQKKIKYE